jgi:hypothetical protein
VSHARIWGKSFQAEGTMRPQPEILEEEYEDHCGQNNTNESRSVGDKGINVGRDNYKKPFWS